MSQRLIKLSIRFGIAALAASTAACNDYLDRRDTISLHAGDAVAANRAIHTIDPWPAHASKTRWGTNGKRTVNAIERYETRQSGAAPVAPATLTLPIAPAPGVPAP
jgi:hypothetical protein